MNQIILNIAILVTDSKHVMAILYRSTHCACALSCSTFLHSQSVISSFVYCFYFLQLSWQW